MMLSPYWTRRYHEAQTDEATRTWIRERYQTDHVETYLDRLGVPRGPGLISTLARIWEAVGERVRADKIGRNTFYAWLRAAGYGEDATGRVRGIGTPTSH